MAKGFHEVSFPRDIAYGSNFGPEFSTDVVTLDSGAEQRNINWKYPRCKGNVSMGVKREADFKRLLTFFMNRKGKAFGFRFYDWLDHEGSFEVIGMGDGNVLSYQLCKNYVDEAIFTNLQRKILKPQSGAVKIYFYEVEPEEAENWSWQKQLEIRDLFAKSIPTGAEQVLNWSVDYATGKVTFTNPPAANTVVLASFLFDVPVRFDTDQMLSSYETWKAYGWPDIPLIELKY